MMGMPHARLPMTGIALTSRSHVPSDQADLESANGETKEDRLRSAIRIRSCVYTVFDYPHCTGWSRWEATLP
jgi:hypothetical protein